MADFNSPIYPAPGVGDLSLQYVKAVLPVGAATVVNIFTVPRGNGRFFVTGVILHDPNASLAGAVGSVSVAFGSASTTGTSLSTAFQLQSMNASTANQFLQVNPGILAFGGATTTNPVAFGLAGGDVVQALITVATAQSTATTSTVLVDLCGYFL